MENLYVERQKILTAFIHRLPEPDPAWPHKVRKVVRCIHEHSFEEYLTVGWLEEECSITNHNFSGNFKRCMGKCPKQYILALRLEAAKEVLSHNQAHIFSLLEIGFEVGFSSYAAFHRAFKKRFGLTPAHWIQQSRGKS